jgi:hypothetical protein
VAATSEVLGRQAELATLGAFLGRLSGRAGGAGAGRSGGAGKTTLLRAGPSSQMRAGSRWRRRGRHLASCRWRSLRLADLLERHLEPVIRELPAPQASAL